MNNDTYYDTNYESLYWDKTPVLIPSFRFEKKTGALNKYLLPFVALISMFTVSVFIGGFVVAFLSSFLQLPDAHILVYVFVPIAVFVLSTGVLIRFFLLLLTAYKIEDNRIICAKMVRGRKMETLRDEIPELVAALFLGPRARCFANMIKLNLKPGFAEEYFDTVLYAKKEYLHPRLIKETKHELVYSCDDNKTLRIRKIYDGICRPEGKGGKSFGVRVALVSVLVFFIALAIAVTDLAISRNKTVKEYEPRIEYLQGKMQSRLVKFGYELERSGVSFSTFCKKVGDRTSEVRYIYNKKGEITKVNVQLYYAADSVDYEAEIRTILATMNAFSENSIDEFIQAVGQNLNGEYTHYRLKGGRYILTLGTSGDYVDIH